jgi:predicted deacetylase
MAERYFLAVLHDVAPQTWADYQPLLATLDAWNVPLTWLVVPDFHHCQPLHEYGGFRQRLDQRLALGDELALHGLFHCDDQPSPRTPKEWFMRRVFTREGEFYQLDEAQARQRLEAGIEAFRLSGWPLQGFVAPAWLMSRGTRQALSRSGLRYTSDAQHLYLLPEYRTLAAPGLVMSSRSAWRRRLSKRYCERLLRRYRYSPVLRLGLHPQDLRQPASGNYWLAVIQRLLDEGRVPLTKQAWIERQAGGHGVS